MCMYIHTHTPDVGFLHNCLIAQRKTPCKCSDWSYSWSRKWGLSYTKKYRRTYMKLSYIYEFVVHTLKKITLWTHWTHNTQTFILDSEQDDMAASMGDLFAFLRLVCVSGKDAFLLESVFRNDVWGFMQLPVGHSKHVCVWQCSFLSWLEPQAWLWCCQFRENKVWHPSWMYISWGC
jgi:hypothetical protein